MTGWSLPPGVQTALLGILPPALIAATSLAVAWRPWSKAPPPLRTGVVGSALAMALGYAVTESLVVHAWPGFPPAERHRWLPFAGLAAAIGAAVWPAGAVSRWRAQDLIALGAFVLVSLRQLRSGGTLSLIIPLTGKMVELPGWVVAALWILVSVTVAGMMRADTARVARCGVRAALTWLVACVGAAVVYVQSYNAIFGQLSGVMAAVLGVFVVVGAVRPKFELVPGLAPVVAVLYVGLMLACSDATALSAMMVLLAGTAPAFAGTGLAARLPPWVTTVLCVLIAAALSVGAVWASPAGFNFDPFSGP